MKLLYLPKALSMEWYEEEVQRTEKEISKLSYDPQTIFYGSSSIRLWPDVYSDFAPFYPVNLGFGGSTLEACIYFFQRIMKPYHPQRFVIYAGDNDLGDGKKPNEVYNYFIQLSACIYNAFGTVPVFYISIKPSLQRWGINDLIIETNKLIEARIAEKMEAAHFIDIYNCMIGADGQPQKNLYAEDGLHLSNDGYILWKQIILTHIS